VRTFLGDISTLLANVIVAHLRATTIRAITIRLFTVRLLRLFTVRLLISLLLLGGANHEQLFLGPLDPYLSRTEVIPGSKESAQSKWRVQALP
jgi:hypothetical protein